MPPYRLIAAAALVLVPGRPARAQQDSTRPPVSQRIQAPAPGPDALTLEQVIELAQQRSHAARTARATRDAARYRDQAFGSRLLPQLSLTGTLPDYSRAIIPYQRPDSTGTLQTVYLPLQRTQGSLALRLSQRLPLTGGELFVSSQLAQVRQTSASVTSRTWSSTPVAFGIRQDILRPNTAGWDQREQSVRRGRDARAFYEAMEDVAIQTTDLFFNAYAARTGLANAEANATVNDTLYRINRGRLEIGRIGENDLLQSELALLRARARLDDARLEHDRALAALRIGIGLAPDAPLEIVVTAAVPDYQVDTARAVSEALRNRAAVLDAELSQVQARRRVAEARLAAGIGATVFASYGYNSSGVATMNLAYDNLLETRTFNVAVSMPLWQWGAYGENVRAARSDRDRTEAQSEQSILQLRHDAKFAALGLLQARRGLVLVATADTVAGRRFEVAYNRYVIGRINIDNLYLAQNEKDQALTQYVEGLRRFWLAHYRLRRTTLFDFAADRPIGRAR